MLRLPYGFPQHIVHLLQSGQKNLPKLVENLGLSGRSGFVQLPCHSAELLLQADILHKRRQSEHLPAQILRLPKAVLQPL